MTLISTVAEDVFRRLDAAFPGTFDSIERFAIDDGPIEGPTNGAPSPQDVVDALGPHEIYGGIVYRQVIRPAFDAGPGASSFDRVLEWMDWMAVHPDLEARQFMVTELAEHIGGDAKLTQAAANLLSERTLGLFLANERFLRRHATVEILESAGVRRFGWGATPTGA